LRAAPGVGLKRIGMLPFLDSANTIFVTIHAVHKRVFFKEKNKFTSSGKVVNKKLQGK
jgi:hypothetical protein